jgi:hypothetical protein
VASFCRALPTLSMPLSIEPSTVSTASVEFSSASTRRTRASSLATTTSNPARASRADVRASKAVVTPSSPVPRLSSWSFCASTCWASVPNSPTFAVSDITLPLSSARAWSRVLGAGGAGNLSRRALRVTRTRFSLRVGRGV